MMLKYKHLFFLLFILLAALQVNGQAQRLQPLSESTQERIDRAEELVSLSTQRGDFGTAAAYLNQIVLIYWQNQRLDLAASALQRAADLYRNTGDHLSLQKVLSNQGLIFLDLENLPSADNSFTLALEAGRRTGEHRIVASSLVDLAYIKTITGDYRAATRLLEEAMQLAIDRNFETMLPNIYLQLSRNYLNMGNIREGEEYRRKYNDITEFLAQQNLRGEFQEREVRGQVRLIEAQAETKARELEIHINQLIYQQQQDSIALIVKAGEDSLLRERERAELHLRNIQLLESEAQRQEAEIQRHNALRGQQRVVIYAALIVTFLLFLIMIILLGRNKQKQRINAVLAEKNEEIQLTSEQLKVAFTKIDEQNHRITQSISYAREIQKSLFPPQQTLNNYLPEAFIFFKPVDMVSGDFYWFKEVDPRKSGDTVSNDRSETSSIDSSKIRYSPNGYYKFNTDKFMISAVDCTGHGVPGAIMSMIGYNQLESITQLGVIQPGEILNKLHRDIRKLLKQDLGENRDGMDLSVCVIDKTRKTIDFAGANHPLLYVRNGELNIIKGDRHSIGGIQKEDVRIFTTHTIPIDQPTCFYIFSDGFTDQFGGENGRSLLLKNFKEILLKIHQEPMEKQRKLLTEYFMNWKGNEEQIDDVMVIGFKLG